MQGSELSPRERSITYRDQHTHILSVFESTSKEFPILILFPAMGVRASYYEAFATYAANMGVTTCTIDWRGHGHSSLRASRTTDWGYEDLVQDIRETLEQIDKLFPGRKKIILGHSLGGQLSSLCLSRYPELVDGIILIASALVHHTGWKGQKQWQPWLANYLFPMIARIFGYFPGKQVGFGGREAKTEMIDWARNGRTGLYQLSGSDFDYDEALKQVSTKLLALPIEHDWFAPTLAVENLIAKFGSDTVITRSQIPAQSEGGKTITHFNWAKYPEHVWPYLEGWLGE